MKINKPLLSILAALMILVFHLWIPVSSTVLERNLIKVFYIGVDIFFLLSAYTLTNSKMEYGTFVKSRFIQIYGKFIIFVLMAVILKGFKASKVFEILTTVELFKKGGGAFLWFIPAIMIFYLVYPLYDRWSFKYKSVVVIIIWFVCCYGLTVLKIKPIMIFLNRIPVILVGEYIKKHDCKNIIVAVVLFVIGGYLLYKFGMTSKLNKPIYQMYYIIAIPMVISIVIFSSYIKETKLLKSLSKFTLELYGLQMIIGFDLENKIYMSTRSPILSNLGCFVVLIVLSYLFNFAYNKCLGLIKK